MLQEERLVRPDEEGHFLGRITGTQTEFSSFLLRRINNNK